MKKSEKGSIGITVLIAVLFFTGLLVLLYASNTNKEQVITEKIDFIKSIYERNVNNINEVYEKAYATLKNKNKQILTAYVENSNTIELTKTLEETITNYRIYGAGDGVGDLVKDTADSNYGKYKIAIRINEKNYIEEEKFTTNSAAAKINENEDYYQVTTNTNTAGIHWQIDGDFKVGDKINAQAKVLYISSADETINDSVTLRIRNITKGMWIHTGRNGQETEFSTITIGKEKTLKFSEVELTSSNYTEGDIIALNISRGLGVPTAGKNEIIFNVYKNTIMLEKSGDSQSGLYTDSETYNIFLDNPLGEGDYLDFKLGKVIRADGTEEIINLPEISTVKDYTKINVSTYVKPSKIEVEYTGYVIE